MTHVVWDAFTHPGRWGVSEVTWLRDDRSRPIRGAGEPRLLPPAVLPLLVAVGLTLVCSLWGVLELRSTRHDPTVRA